MKKEGFLKSIPFVGMSIIELLVIVFFIFRECLKWMISIDVDIVLKIMGIVFVSITIFLSFCPQIRYYLKIIMYGELALISIYLFTFFTIMILMYGIGIKKVLPFRSSFLPLFSGILVALNLIIGIIKLKKKSIAFILEESGIFWAVLLFLLLSSIAMAIDVYQLLSIKYFYLSSFLFLVILIIIYYKFTKNKGTTLEKDLKSLIDFQIFDVIVSIIFYLIIMIIGSAILIFYFPTFSRWMNLWFPLVAVSSILLIILKSYKDDIKKYDKEVLIFSWILCMVLFISIIIMIVQKNIWGTYTGLKAILGALLAIDAIFLLTLKQKQVFMDKFENDTSLIKNPNSKLIVKRIELLLGNFTTLFTFVNVIFYDNTVTKKIIKILSPFLEQLISSLGYSINKIDDHIKIIVLSILIIFGTYIFSLLLLFVEEYICKKIFFNKKQSVIENILNDLK